MEVMLCNLMLEILKQGPKTEEDGKEDFLPTTTEIQ